MEKHIASAHQYLAQRGHMVSFLMMALMVTSWINTFQTSVNADIVSVYM